MAPGQRAEATSGELGRQSVSAVKWSALGTLAQYALQLAAQIVLARLLGPESYGLFAIGLLVITFSNFIADFGFAWNLVQAQELCAEDIRFIFTWQLLSGSLAALVLFVAAPTIAALFNDLRVAEVVRWLSCACVISAATAPGANLLRRNMDFKALSIIQVVSYLFGYVAIAVPLALSGAGVWALVAAWLAQALCNLSLTLVRSPHPMKPLFWYRGASRQSGMGVTVFVTNLCNWFLNNLDRMLLGSFLNAQSVGIYSVGYNLANTPNSLLIGALQPAFLSTGARMQADPQRLRRIYLSVVATIWVLVAPLFALLAMVARDLVGTLYGPAWAGSGIVMTILAIAMPAYVTWAMSTSILWNTERRHWEALLQLPILAAALLAYYHYANDGVVAVAAVATVVLFGRAIVITGAACWRLGIGFGDLHRTMARSATMIVVATTATFAGMAGGESVGMKHASALAGGLLGGGSALLLILVLFPRFLGDAVNDIVDRFSPPFFKRLYMTRCRPSAGR